MNKEFYQSVDAPAFPSVAKMETLPLLSTRPSLLLIFASAPRFEIALYSVHGATVA